MAPPEFTVGIEEEISHVYTILKDGTSADRQIAVHEETGSLEKGFPCRDPAGQGLTPTSHS